MSQYSTESITTPGQRPVRVDFNETERGTFVASVKDSLDGFAIRAFSTVEISRAEFDPNVFGAASMALFTETPKRLDHGVLSIPGRTNTINADLDKYKAAQAKIEKREREGRGKGQVTRHGPYARSGLLSLRPKLSATRRAGGSPPRFIAKN